MNERIKKLATKEAIKTLATKAESKAQQGKFAKLQKHDLSYFLGKNFFGDDGSQNMFVDQPILTVLELKKDKVTMFLIGNQEGYIPLNISHYIKLKA